MLLQSHAHAWGMVIPALIAILQAADPSCAKISIVCSSRFMVNTTEIATQHSISRLFDCYALRSSMRSTFHHRGSILATTTMTTMAAADAILRRGYRNDFHSAGSGVSMGPGLIWGPAFLRQMDWNWPSPSPSHLDSIWDWDCI
jgi:hypothetical protein